MERFPTAIGRRIIAAIDGLATNPRPPRCIKLADGDAWRIRVGDYRVIYHIDDAARTVTIIRVAHRDSAYR